MKHRERSRAKCAQFVLADVQRGQGRWKVERNCRQPDVATHDLIGWVCAEAALWTSRCWYGDHQCTCHTDDTCYRHHCRDQQGHISVIYLNHIPALASLSRPAAAAGTHSYIPSTLRSTSVWLLNSHHRRRIRVSISKTLMLFELIQLVIIDASQFCARVEGFVLYPRDRWWSHVISENSSCRSAFGYLLKQDKWQVKQELVGKWPSFEYLNKRQPQ